MFKIPPLDIASGRRQFRLFEETISEGSEVPLRLIKGQGCSGWLSSVGEPIAHELANASLYS